MNCLWSCLRQFYLPDIFLQRQDIVMIQQVLMLAVGNHQHMHPGHVADVELIYFYSFGHVSIEDRSSE
jgi:hypothetical protein